MARDVAFTPHANVGGLLTLISSVNVNHAIDVAATGVATLYNNWKKAKAAAVTKAIQTQLEAAKWSDFSSIKASE